MNVCIGLFGTCGKSTWRKDLFIPAYKAKGFTYFNPQVEDWKPECAEIEAQHLATDSIVLFPITHETYAVGSLAETGFSILNAIKFDDRRDLIILIDSFLDDELFSDKERAKESLRARALVKQHLKKLHYKNIYLVDTMDKMLELSLKLYELQSLIKPYQELYSL